MLQKRVQRVTLAQRDYIYSLRRRLSLKHALLTVVRNSRFTSSPLENNGTSRGRDAVEYSDSTRPTVVKVFLPHKVVILRLMEDFATGKSSNEHGFFGAVTSLNMICEEKIRDLTGDTLFL